VDDWPEVLEIYTYTLQSAGYEVVTATTSGDALKAIASFDFDLAVVDFHLGEESGLALANEIHTRRPHIRIIISTGTVDSDQIIDTGFPIHEKARGGTSLAQLISQCLRKAG